MFTKSKNIKTVVLCVLGLLIGICTGCRHTDGNQGFSFSFNTDSQEGLAEAAKKYESLCKELESRGFKEIKITEKPDVVSSLYEGKYNGFSLKVNTRYLLSISKEEPEFLYDVSSEQTKDISKLDKALKDLGVLMEKWVEK
ncbi:MAG: hypothetical protein K9M75_03325 [Phycisphaerae bacterium]|nr:hypothetical protein [Phycisphaerae bacterium]